MQSTLSDSQTAQYWDDGFLFPLDLMSPDEAAQWRAEIETIEDDWLAADLPLPLNSYKRVNAHVVLPMAAKLASNPRVLDIVEGVLGPDILVWSAEFFIKEPNTTAYVSMHQDLTYWGLGAIDGLVTAWIALSPATVQSGCMDFVKGSHKNPILPHADSHGENNLLSRGQEVAVDIAAEDKTAIELHPGQMSLHHGLTIHGSGPNASDDRRIGFVVRYIKPEIAQEVADKDFAMLARGADRIGNFIHVAPPQTAFAPQSLALYEEIRTAQAAALMKGSKDTKRLYG
ncbi:phytanoyl-CoA dioxygenase family protein [Shimia haliotis]|uniref:Chlorinating enzyme n=1 Tax=Shimia haliotis TaxID=1280847 RepID=A0A1I4F7I8_9RHOB|nr:phytanoyl-CoA dioxygenase family protein [Shimia haliotis]SFL12371.1 chlorinating enzyme [Shimia haliotis]